EANRQNLHDGQLPIVVAGQRSRWTVQRGRRIGGEGSQRSSWKARGAGSGFSDGICADAADPDFRRILAYLSGNVPSEYDAGKAVQLCVRDDHVSLLDARKLTRS